MKYFQKIYFLFLNHIYFDFNKFIRLIVSRSKNEGHMRVPKVAPLGGHLENLCDHLRNLGDEYGNQ